MSRRRTEGAARQTARVERDERGIERHPAFGLISLHRVQHSSGASLFDSDMRHQRFLRLTISRASRRRDLNRDYLHPEEQVVELSMSEAQWAAFVSSVGNGNGVPCTIEGLPGEPLVPGLPYEPRLRESVAEVEGAAAQAMEAIQEAFARVEEKPTKANLRTLRSAIENAPANMRFAAESLSEHTENVVQKARADIEAMVISQAKALGVSPDDLNVVALPAPDESEDDGA